MTSCQNFKILRIRKNNEFPREREWDACLATWPQDGIGRRKWFLWRKTMTLQLIFGASVAFWQSSFIAQASIKIWKEETTTATCSLVHHVFLFRHAPKWSIKKTRMSTSFAKMTNSNWFWTSWVIKTERASVSWNMNLLWTTTVLWYQKILLTVSGNNSPKRAKDFLIYWRECWPITQTIAGQPQNALNSRFLTRYVTKIARNQRSLKSICLFSMRAPTTMKKTSQIYPWTRWRKPYSKKSGT